MGEKDVILVEMPNINLEDDYGKNWGPNVPDAPNASKLELATSLSEHNRVRILNPKRTEIFERVDSSSIPILRRQPIVREQYGEADWDGRHLTKVRWGNRDFREILEEAAMSAASSGGVVGLTANFLKERNVICEAIKIINQVSNGRAKVVIGGRDAMAEPEPYIEAGVDAVVKNVDGSTNQAIIELVTGQKVSRHLTSKDVVVNPQRIFRPFEESLEPIFSPPRLLLPPEEFILQTMGSEHWENHLPSNLNRIGAMKKIWRLEEEIVRKSPCEQTCDFCTVPLLGRPDLGRMRFDVEATLDYAKTLMKAGVRTISFIDDQFLIDILYPGGMEKLTYFMDILRAWGLAWVFGNGLQISKFCENLGITMDQAEKDPYFKDRIEDLTRAGTPPSLGSYKLNELLVKSVLGWESDRLGWDGTPGVGCAALYNPLEDLVGGEKARGMRKLLPLDHVFNVIPEIYRVSGMKKGTAGLMVGRAGETAQHMQANFIAALELKNVMLELGVEYIGTPFGLVIASGTPAARHMYRQLEKLGVLKNYLPHPEILNNFWTPKPNEYMTAREIADGQQAFFHLCNMDIKFDRPWHSMDRLN